MHVLRGAEERGARHPRPEGPDAGRDVSQEAAQGARGDEECREAEKEGETDCQSGFRREPGHRRWFGPVQRSLVQKKSASKISPLVVDLSLRRSSCLRKIS